MSADQIKTMVRSGMFFGSHGYDHFWMDGLTPEAQVDEIDRSLSFLTAIGATTADWVMCYPYGAYNDALLSVLKQRGCALGITTRAAVADLSIDRPLELPRLDTNDFPI
jgi:peptidoglycan/xylan/chitin deacetylase (PgdA/CDA1 family)